MINHKEEVPTVIPAKATSHSCEGRNLPPVIPAKAGIYITAMKGYIYFITNPTNKVLYIGVTNSLIRRIDEHKSGGGSVFTAKYNCKKLVYYEVYPDIEQAIERETRLKRYKREWKDNLVNKVNPNWEDLYRNLASDPDVI